MTDKQQPIIDWDPAPGYLLCKPLKREELAALYDRAGGSNLSLPDKVGKVSDSVGAGIVIKLGPVASTADGWQFPVDVKISNTDPNQQFTDAMPIGLQPGDYIAWMPFTDQLIEIDGVKYSLVGYDKIRAVRKGEPNAR